MEIGKWDTAGCLNEIYPEVRRLGLEQNIAEHDAFGFTIVPPDKVGTRDFHTRVLDAILGMHNRRTGQKLTRADLSSASLPGDMPLKGHLDTFGEDPIFEDVLLNPVVKVLSQYYCGNGRVLSGITTLIKRRDETPSHPLHIDTNNIPSPPPPYPLMMNITYALTDYTLESGPLAVVPSSHTFGRGPMQHEREFLKPDSPVKPIPVLCEAGSLILFGGNTWHAAFPRTAPGLRVTMVMVFVRPFMKQMHDLSRVPKEVYDRHPEFKELLGQNYLYPMHEGQTPDVFEAYWAAGRTRWGAPLPVINPDTRMYGGARGRLEAVGPSKS